MTSWAGLSGCQASFLGESTGLKHLTPCAVSSNQGCKTTSFGCSTSIESLFRSFALYSWENIWRTWTLELIQWYWLESHSSFLPDSQISPKCTFCHVMHKKKQDSYVHIYFLYIPLQRGYSCHPFFLKEIPSPRQGAAVGMAAALSGVAFVAPSGKSSGTVRTPALRGQVQSNAQAAPEEIAIIWQDDHGMGYGWLIELDCRWLQDYILVKSSWQVGAKYIIFIKFI